MFKYNVHVISLYFKPSLILQYGILRPTYATGVARVGEATVHRPRCQREIREYTRNGSERKILQEASNFFIYLFFSQRLRSLE